MSAPSMVSLVPALAESLDALEAYQHTLVTRLKAIHARLLQGDGTEDEILPTLTYYINQATFIQHKMTLIYARVGDMKRRSHRLKDHRAKQDQRIAEWMDQERTRLVPAASASLALAQSLVPGSTAIRQDTASVPPLSLSASGVDDVATPRSVPSLRRMPSALASRYGDLADDGPRIAVLELPASVPSVALAMGEAVDRSSSSPGTHEVQDAAPPPAARMSDAVHPVAIKRKGKRRVRMPTIE